MTATVQPGASVADLKNFVNGEYVTAEAGRTSEVVDPSTGQVEKGAMMSGPSSTLLITQGPATGLPKIVG